MCTAAVALTCRVNSLHLELTLSVCLCVCLSVCLPARLSACLSVCLSVCLCIRMSVQMSSCPSGGGCRHCSLEQADKAHQPKSVRLCEPDRKGVGPCGCLPVRGEEPQAGGLLQGGHHHRCLLTAPAVPDSTHSSGFGRMPGDQ